MLGEEICRIGQANVDNPIQLAACTKKWANSAIIKADCTYEVYAQKDGLTLKTSLCY
jgi:hypothetical protein